MSEVQTDLDAIVVGAGFGGLYMLHRLHRLGLKARILEKAGGVGGTWYWNSYPGARCDIESLQYSYKFDEALQQEWVWTERYASGAEILRYLNHVCDRFNLRGDIQFNACVVSAVYDEAGGFWSVTVDSGQVLTARYLISASGVLSSANMPDIAGRDSFAGAILHTGNWPREGYDFAGKRVAIVGTGSSGVQVMPEIAKQAAQVTVFQRTAAYTVPARNAPLDPAVQAAIKADYRGYRERWGRMPLAAEFHHRDVSALTDPPESARAEMEARWARGGASFGASFNDLMMNAEANKVAAEFVREKIRATVKDPATAEALSPKQLFGCKRICLDSDYYATYNQPHVSLVNLAGSGIERIVPQGIVVAGRTYECDVIVFATGFDALTGSLLRMGIRGQGGQRLADKWAAGARTYLGIQTAGFPNLFMVTGPQSPSVFTNMVPAIEQDVDFIADCLAYLKVKGLHSIEAQPDAEDAWVKHVGAVAESTLYTSCNSWYLGANIPGKPRVFLAHIGFPNYVDKCTEVAAKGYEGFRLS